MTIWQNRGEYHHARLTEHLDQASTATSGYLDTLHAVGLSATRGWAVVNRIVNREALTLAVNDVFWLCAFLFLALIPLVWLARPPFGNAGTEAVH